MPLLLPLDYDVPHNIGTLSGFNPYAHDYSSTPPDDPLGWVGVADLPELQWVPAGMSITVTGTQLGFDPGEWTGTVEFGNDQWIGFTPDDTEYLGDNSASWDQYTGYGDCHVLTYRYGEMFIDWATKVIFVPKSMLTLVTENLYSLDTDVFRLALKDIEDDEEGMTFLDTHRHNTEVTVAGTTFARTIEIINGYSVEFENGEYSVRLEGSNNNIFDIQNDILVQNNVQLISGNSAGLIAFELTDSIRDLKYSIETLRNTHKATGLSQTIYWDPYLGNDDNSGLAPETAVNTFTKAHDLVTAGNHDVIIAMPGNPMGITVTNESIEITKNDVLIRGPGADFVVAPLTPTVSGAGIDINTEGCYLGGMVITGAYCVGATRGVHIEGNNIKMENIIVTDWAGDGVHVQSSTGSFIERGAISNNTGTGLILEDSTNCYISNMQINNNAGSGVDFINGDSNVISETLFIDNTGSSLNFDANSSNNVAIANCSYIGNSTSTDLGTNNNVLTQAGSVLDEPLADHNDPGTVGEKLGKILTIAKFLGLK